MLKESPHLVKIKTKEYKRMFLSVISGSNTQSQVNMHLDIMGRLNVNENEKVEITKCGVVDHVIRILTSFDITGVAPKVEKSGDFRSRWNSLGAKLRGMSW
jgi:hypothetical protein